jgi:hypothetical protein
MVLEVCRSPFSRRTYLVTRKYLVLNFLVFGKRFKEVGLVKEKEKEKEKEGQNI